MEKLIFSRVSLSNYYHQSQEYDGGLLRVTHGVSGREYVARPFGSAAGSPCGQEYIDELTTYVLRPVCGRAFFDWPRDIVEIEEDQKYRLYLIEDAEPEEVRHPLSEVFMHEQWDDVFNWHLESRQHQVLSLLDSVCELHRSGYYYCDYSLYKISMNENGDVFFPFSGLIRDCAAEHMVLPQNLALELKPVRYQDGDAVEVNEADEMYSVMTIVFYLMFGRLPFDGVGLVGKGYPFIKGQDNNDRVYRDEYFKSYREYPHFIFDTADKCNDIASIPGTDRLSRLWKEFPAEVRGMFEEQFRAVSDEDETPYTAGQWRDILKQVFAQAKRG